jgi:hypothetical protein
VVFKAAAGQDTTQQRMQKIALHITENFQARNKAELPNNNNLLAVSAARIA